MKIIALFPLALTLASASRFLRKNASTDPTNQLIDSLQMADTKEETFCTNLDGILNSPDIKYIPKVALKMEVLELDACFVYHAARCFGDRQSNPSALIKLLPRELGKVLNALISIKRETRFDENDLEEGNDAIGTVRDFFDGTPYQEEIFKLIGAEEEDNRENSQTHEY